MKKLFKALKLLFFLSFLAILGFFGLKIVRNPTTIRPYPYRLKAKISVPEEAEKAHILIIGDQNGKNYGPWQKLLTEKVSSNTRENLRVFNWSFPNEGIHRTIQRLKKLKKLPPVIVYMGGSSEFYEKKFRLKDKKIIEGNFAKYRNDKLISLILSFPFISRIIYSPPKYQILKEVSPNPNIYSGATKQMQMELTYEIFGMELNELLHHIKGRDGNLIVVPPALELERPPGKVCDNSQSNSVLIAQNDIKKLLSKNQLKEAFRQLKKLSEVTVGNALTFYLLGQTATKLGHFREAKQFYYKAGIYDCDQGHPNIIINKFLISKAEENGFYVIDFNRIVNSQLGLNVLFKDDGSPQDIFYEELTNQLVKRIKSILEL